MKEINFKYDGSDKLYLLGDYVDWGPKSIETLLFVMELTNKYSFIEAIIGNHDLMFLEQIKGYKKNPKNQDMNWLYNNRGLNTWEQFLLLSKEKQDEIETYLDKLDYRIESKINNKSFLMAHACPVQKFEYDENQSKEDNLWEFLHLRNEAVWERIIRKVPNVIEWYNHCEKDNKYDMFICGHTINSDLKININEDRGYIDIDCGAKVLGYKGFEESEKACLAALRLEDYKEFYQK